MDAGCRHGDRQLIQLIQFLALLLQLGTSALQRKTEKADEVEDRSANRPGTFSQAGDFPKLFK